MEGAGDWELISLGDSQNIGLHTAKLEDKAMACQMLVCYARVMKNHFRPYVDEVSVGKYTYAPKIFVLFLLIK